MGHCSRPCLPQLCVVAGLTPWGASMRVREERREGRAKKRQERGERCAPVFAYAPLVTSVEIVTPLASSAHVRSADRCSAAVDSVEETEHAKQRGKGTIYPSGA